MAKEFSLPQKTKMALERLTSQDLMGQRERVCAKEGTVYLRVTRRLGPNSKLVLTVELGSIDVHPKHQKQGVFNSVLDVFEEISIKTGRYFFVESIQNEVVLKAVQKRGYTPDLMLGESCYWKSPEKMAVKFIRSTGL